MRTEPHPRFYTDTTDTVPIAVPALLRTEWWLTISFVVFKSPGVGRTHIFRPGELYAPTSLPLSRSVWLGHTSEAFRIASGPALRICTARLTEESARRFAGDLAEVLREVRVSTTP